MKNLKQQIQLLIIVIPVVLVLGSCTKLTNVDAPFTSVNQENIYTQPALATGVLTGIYSSMSGDNNFGFDGNAGESAALMMGLSSAAGLYADELRLVKLSGPASYYFNNLTPSSNTGPWSNIYSYIFRLNSALEGISGSSKLNDKVRNQLIGEAKFMRAFCYFYLVNLYGTAPIVFSTDFMVTRMQSRNSRDELYAQIEADLKEAELLISDQYLRPDLTSSNPSERFRPTKWAVRALLARTFLYEGKWQMAEIEASKLIDNNGGLFELEIDLNKVFKKGSKEAIWQLQDVNDGINTGESNFIPSPPEVPEDNSPLSFAYLSDELIDAFENGDKRKANWVGEQVIKDEQTNLPIERYYYAYKFKNKTPEQSASRDECPMIFRLAEQYLIRAEARFHNNNLTGVRDDLNAIRNRAGLDDSNASADALLEAIFKERRIELFTEWGNRWLDIKRLNKANELMPGIAQKKGATWAPYKTLFPIPLSDVLYGPNLKQTEGY